jgi:excinuclease UvrABC nuclease subunit
MAKKKENQCKSYHVYMFLDKNDEVLYVGQTTNIIKRLQTHFNMFDGHLPFECYEQIEKVLYCEVDSEYKMKLYESYYIIKHKTKYNKVLYNIKEAFTNLPELNWEQINIVLVALNDVERIIGNDEDDNNCLVIDVV